MSALLHQHYGQKVILLIDEYDVPLDKAFQINTSGNDLVKRFIDKADKTTQNEIERPIAGEAIEKAVRLDLTYDELDTSIDNLWSVLFTTGYLTQTGRAAGGVCKLVIPNRMISVLDTKAPGNQKENFYHGPLLGLLRSEANWLILCNAESGDGFAIL